MSPYMEKGTLQVMIQLQISRWGSCLALSRWPNAITASLGVKVGRVRVKEEDVMEAEIGDVTVSHARQAASRS